MAAGGDKLGYRRVHTPMCTCTVCTLWLLKFNAGQWLARGDRFINRDPGCSVSR